MRTRVIVVATCVLGLPVLLLPGAAVAQAPQKPMERISVIGFSLDDGLKFLAVIAPAGKTEGVLHVWDGVSGKIIETNPARISFPEGGPALLPRADDPGVERYKSGTPTRTEFQAGSSRVRVEIEAQGQGAGLRIARGKCESALPLVERGTDVNLLSVLASKDGKSLAVIVKYTLDDVRRIGVRVVGLVEGALGGLECIAARVSEPELEPGCLAALARLRGGFAHTDASGNNDYNLNFEGDATNLQVIIMGTGENVGGTLYSVTSCTRSQGTLEVGLGSGGMRERYVLGPRKDGSLSVRCVDSSCWIARETWIFERR